MRCGFGGEYASGGLGHILGEMVAFIGQLASHVLVILTSGPAVGLLVALTLLLATMALLKPICARRAPAARNTRSKGEDR